MMAILRVESCREVSRLFLITIVFVFLGVTECLKFTLEPQSVDVQAKKSLSLSCSAETDNEPIEYTWKRDGRSFRTTTRRTVQEDGTQSVLKIDPVQKNDAGSYICEARDANSEKITSQAAEVVVYSLCSNPEVVIVSGVVVQTMDVILKCKCNHAPTYSTTVAWKKDGAELQEGGHYQMEDNKLMITNISKTEEGKYSCSVTNKLDSVKSSDQDSYTLELEDGSPPRILTKPTDVVVVRKKPAMLHCKYMGDPIPQMKWLFEDDGIGDDSSMTVLSNGSLSISQVYPRHEGKYTCSVTNKFNSVAAHANIEIAYITKIPSIPDVLVARGSPARLQCRRPSGAPKPDLKWTMSDGSPLPSDPRYNTDCSSDSSDCTLNIDRTKVEDSGEFICVASNGMAKTRTRPARLIVQVPPKIIEAPQDVTIIEGQFLELVCKASGSPKPNIMWQKEEGVKNKTLVAVKPPAVVHSNGSLTISSVQRSDSARYFCSASTPAGWFDEKEATVKVRWLVKVSPRHRTEILLDAKKDAKLRCLFDGEPPITVVWSKVGKKDLPKRADARNSTLVLRRAGPSDNGVFICKASNSFSRAETFVNITVVRFPKFVVVPANKTATETSSIWFHCNATGSPKPVISWSRQQKNGDQLDPKRFVQHKNGSMEIKNVQTEDEGDYYCIAGNRGQMAQTSVHLQVMANPKAQASTSTSMVRTIGIAVGCAAAYIILVVGLMIYCKGRRTQYARKKSVINGTLTQGDNKADEEVALNHLNSLYKRRGSYDKWQFPRHDLEALSTLGNGVYGRCFMAKAGGIKDGEKETTVIVKALMSKDEITKEEFMLEMDMMCRVQNENVVQLLGLCKEEEPYYIIAETLDKGDLKTFLLTSSNNGRSTILNSTQKIELCSQIAAGMNYLSAHDYIHKDLAARNILISKDLQIKIGFMSLSQDTNRSDYYFFNNVFIPLRWMPSEAILEREFSDKSDVWSFGVVMWEIFTNGKRPYEERSDDEVLKCQRNNDLKLTKPDHCTPEVFEVMNKCWDMDPAERPSFGELANDFSDMDGDSNV